MNQVQFTLRIDDETYSQSKSIAEKENRSLNQVFCLLLKQAIKEKERLRQKSWKTKHIGLT